MYLYVVRKGRSINLFVCLPFIQRIIFFPFPFPSFSLPFPFPFPFFFFFFLFIYIWNLVRYYADSCMLEGIYLINPYTDVYARYYTCIYHTFTTDVTKFPKRAARLEPIIVYIYIYVHIYLFQYSRIEFRIYLYYIYTHTRYSEIFNLNIPVLWYPFFLKFIYQSSSGIIQNHFLNRIISIYAETKNLQRRANFSNSIFNHLHSKIVNL